MRDPKNVAVSGYGCLAVFLALIVCAALAYYVRPSIAWAMVPIIAFWLVYSTKLAKKAKRLLQDGFEEAFGSFAGTKPEMKRGDSYGFPEITLHFQSEDDMNLAADEGRTKLLKEHLVRMYSGGGWDARKGFHTQYEGWLEELRAALAAGPDAKREWTNKQEAARERADRGGRPGDHA